VDHKGDKWSATVRIGQSLQGSSVGFRTTANTAVMGGDRAQLRCRAVWLGESSHASNGVDHSRRQACRTQVPGEVRRRFLDTLWPTARPRLSAGQRQLRCRRAGVFTTQQGECGPSRADKWCFFRQRRGRKRAKPRDSVAPCPRRQEPRSRRSRGRIGRRRSVGLKAQRGVWTQFGQS